MSGLGCEPRYYSDQSLRLSHSSISPLVVSSVAQLHTRKQARREEVRDLPHQMESQRQSQAPAFQSSLSTVPSDLADEGFLFM